MSEFTDAEIEYLDEQRLGRLATVGPDGHPHIVPVGFTYDADADAIQISGHDFAETKKFRDAERNPKVAFVVDDLASVDPWRPRATVIRGLAETFRNGGEQVGAGSDSAWMRITPERIVSWGLDSGGE